MQSELEEAKTKAQQIQTKPNRFQIGASVVVVVMLVVLTFISVNTSSVLSRQSPVLEYLSCWNGRLAEKQIAFDELILLYSARDADEEQIPPSSESVNRATQKLLEKGLALRQANDPDGPNPCPSLPGILRDDKEDT